MAASWSSFAELASARHFTGFIGAYYWVSKNTLPSMSLVKMIASLDITLILRLSQLCNALSLIAQTIATSAKTRRLYSSYSSNLMLWARQRRHHSWLSWWTGRYDDHDLEARQSHRPEQMHSPLRLILELAENVCLMRFAQAGGKRLALAFAEGVSATIWVKRHKHRKESTIFLRLGNRMFFGWWLEEKLS